MPEQAQVAQARPPLVEMRHVSVSFGGIRAVDDCSIDLYPGEVVGLVGHNAAGKSTLIKVLSGAYRADAGEIWIDGKLAPIHSARDARDYNIETIYQTLALADNLDRSSAAVAAKIIQFTGSGLQKVETFTSDGSRALSGFDRTLRGVNRDPQGLIFGNKNRIPPYNGSR